MRGGTQNALVKFTLLAAIAALLPVIVAGAKPAPTERPRCGRIDQEPAGATLHELRTSLLCLVNRARESHGIPRLKYNAELRRAATGHSNDMVEHGHLSHAGSHGSSLAVRVARAGYLARASSYAVAENIGGGPGRRYGSPVGVLRMWMHSPGHRANILDRSFRDFGIGAARGFPTGGGRRAATYTLDLGARS